MNKPLRRFSKFLVDCCETAQEDWEPSVGYPLEVENLEVRWRSHDPEGFCVRWGDKEFEVIIKEVK